MADIELITPDELAEIRRIWVYEKHEIEDSLPLIFEKTLGIEFPGLPSRSNAYSGSRKSDCSVNSVGTICSILS